MSVLLKLALLAEPQFSRASVTAAAIHIASLCHQGTHETILSASGSLTINHVNDVETRHAVPASCLHSHQQQCHRQHNAAWPHCQQWSQHVLTAPGHTSHLAQNQLQQQLDTHSAGAVPRSSRHLQASSSWVAQLQQSNGWLRYSCFGSSTKGYRCSKREALWCQPPAAVAAIDRALSTSSTPHPASSTDSDSAAAASGANGNGGSSSSSSPTWVQQYLPQQVQPYAQLMRLEKPIGSWLLAWPGLWSIALAAGPGHLPDLWLSSLFGVGAVVMRGAGCTINDLWDKDIDKQVARTRSRPLAAGTVSTFAALAFLGAQLSLGLSILLQLNTYTQLLGVCSLALVVAYPLMKRVTWWPQAFLGLTFNYGVLMGWAAVQGSCEWPVVLPMYLSGVCWTLVYDTIYAHQDKRDDALVGVKSTALLFGERTKQWLGGFAALQTAGLLLAGAAAGCGAPYYAALVAAAGHQAWQLGSVDLNNGPDCMAKFVSNKWYGGLIYAGIVASNLLA